MLVKIICKNCNEEFEKEIKTPIFCKTSCRTGYLVAQNRIRWEQERLAKANNSENNNNQSEPIDVSIDSFANENTINLENNDQPEPVNESTVGTGEASEVSDSGQSAPTENPVDTPPMPEGDSGADSGQA